MLANNAASLMFILVMNADFVLSMNTRSCPLFYRMNEGKSIHEVECHAADTIYELKNQLKELIALTETFDLSLSFAGKELMDDDQTLADASICAQSMIEVRKVFANGYYQFTTFDDKKTLDISRPIIRLKDFNGNADDNYHAQKHRFLVERQSCGYYTIQSNATGFYLRIKKLKRLCYIVQSDKPDLFDFIHHIDDVWFITIAKSNKMLTISPTKSLLIPVRQFDLTHPVVEKQLFHCRKSRGITSKMAIDVHDCGFNPFPSPIDQELANALPTFVTICLCMFILFLISKILS